MTVRFRRGPIRPSRTTTACRCSWSRKSPGTENEEFRDPGLSGTEIKVLGYRGMKEYELSFDGFRLARRASCCSAGRAAWAPGSGRLMTTFESAASCIHQTAARAIGVAQAALDEATKYAKERIQFGKALVESCVLPVCRKARADGRSGRTPASAAFTFYSARMKDFRKGVATSRRDGQAYSRPGACMGAVRRRDGADPRRETATPRSTRRRGSSSTRASSRSSRGQTRSRRTSSRAACSNKAKFSMSDAYLSPRYGRMLEEFEVGAVYDHPWEVTVDAGLQALCAGSFLDATPLYASAHYARRLGFRDRPVHPLMLLNFGLSFSVHDVSEQAIAHLAYIDVRFPNAWRGYAGRHGARVEHRPRREARERGAKRGVVHVRTILRAEDERIVFQFERKVLVKGGPAVGSRPAQVGDGKRAGTVPGPDSARMPALFEKPLGLTSARGAAGFAGFFEDFAPGDVICHDIGRTVSEAGSTCSLPRTSFL